MAIIAARPAARERFLDFIYNGNHLFASKIDGQSAEGADGSLSAVQPLRELPCHNAGRGKGGR